VTGELSPAGSPGDGPPELRASHADRDRVVELLRIAAGDGRLTAEELDERLEAALTARTQRELTVLTADLPAGPAPGLEVAAAPPKEVVRILRRGGNARRSGHWAVPRRMEIKVAGGNVRLDFTEAVITSPVLHVDADVRGGSFVIITRPGVVVDADEVEMIGGRVIIRDPEGPLPPPILRVEISGQIRGGNVRAHPPRPPRRTFWQWLLRRPRPHGQAAGSAIRP
jgi:Domain of unknown function (DUF1707)